MSDPKFLAERLAALSRLSAEINAASAPPQIQHPVVVDESGRVTLPVPHHDAPITMDLRGRGADRPEPRFVSAELHAGLTLQWAPMQGGALVEFRGGAPDGEAQRDAAVVFLTERGLDGLITDLQAIVAAVRVG